ncbi:hypothetical protein HYW84_03340 [Candidatus Peregrinibacteria bacterium]|nr:hypothetical protein [Candidatus Peregrinibacteria bacterium]
MTFTHIAMQGINTKDAQKWPDAPPDASPELQKLIEIERKRGDVRNQFSNVMNRAGR